MIHVFHTPTGWKVCQEYPEKPDFEKYNKDHFLFYGPWKRYEAAVSLSIANAVDVREEDQDWVKRKVFFRGNYFPLPDMEESEQELKDWKPDDNQVYALPDLDVEIKLQGRPKGSKKWMDESNLISPVSNWESRKLAHVFRKMEEKVDKPEEPKGYVKAQEAANRREQITQILEAHYGNGKAIHKAVHEIDKFYTDMPKEEPKMEESQKDLWNEVAVWFNSCKPEEFKMYPRILEYIMSKFHLTRVK